MRILFSVICFLCICTVLTAQTTSPGTANRVVKAIKAGRLIGNTRIGVIRTGSYADIIAVAADPLKDVRALETPSFVMKGGVVYK